MKTKDLKSGPELDALVAEKVMGFKWWVHSLGSSAHPGQRFLAHEDINPGWVTVTCSKEAKGTEPVYDGKNKNEAIPQYSTDISAAFEVLSRIREGGIDFYLTNRGPDAFELRLFRDKPLVREIGRGTTIPEAICRAALGVFDND